MQTKIMVFGTFDGLHEGHKNFFQQARDLASEPFLVVSVARDSNVAKIKGRLPRLNEQERVALVRELITDPRGPTPVDTLVDKVVLGGDEDYITHIIDENPSIIALGYDQEAYVENLADDLKRAGLKTKIVRMKPFEEHIYKNRLLHREKII